MIQEEIMPPYKSHTSNMVTKLSLGFSIGSLFFKQLTFIIHETNHIDENLQTVVTHKVYILSNSNTQTCIINSKIPPKKKKKTQMEKVSTTKPTSIRVVQHKENFCNSISLITA